VRLATPDAAAGGGIGRLTVAAVEEDTGQPGSGEEASVAAATKEMLAEAPQLEKPSDASAVPSQPSAQVSEFSRGQISAPAVDTPVSASVAVAAQTSEWETRVNEQRVALETSNRSRAELRAAVEDLRGQAASLQAEHERLADGGAVADVEALRTSLAASHASCTERASLARESLPAASAAVAEAAEVLSEAKGVAAEAAETLEARKERLQHFETRLLIAEESATAAQERLQRMISVEEVQRVEAKSRTDREALDAADAETRRLRAALAESLSSGADLPNAMKELGVLRESAEGAAQRIQAIEVVNSQLEGKVQKLMDEIARLKKGAVDLRSEEDLMREVILQQSEHLVRRVEDLTDERRTADLDRKRLLGTAADLLERVDNAEIRLARSPQLESNCRQLEAGAQTLEAEVERLRRTNGALCQQVLGEDGEGPLAGVLLGDTPANVGVDDDEVRQLQEEVCRLVRGRSLRRSLPGAGVSVRGDAGALALQLQQLLAEREEAFWVERQRLSDRVMALERARGGRTGALLRHYDTVARGGSAGGAAEGPATGSSLAAAPAAAAAAATVMAGGVRKLRDSVLRAAA